MAGWGKKRRAELAEFLSRYDTIYPDEDVLATWAKVRAALKKKGKPLSIQDSWVAATALARETLLIGHDSAFRQVPGLKLACRVP